MNPNYVKHLLVTGGVLIGMIFGAVGVEQVQGARIWVDHGEFIVLGVLQVGTLCLMVGYMISHSATARDMRADIAGIGSKLDMDERHLLQEDARAIHHEGKFKAIELRLDKHADRTSDLRNYSEDLNFRVCNIEDRLRIARDRALIRTGALHGEHWMEDGKHIDPSHPAEEPTA